MGVCNRPFAKPGEELSPKFCQTECGGWFRERLKGIADYLPGYVTRDEWIHACKLPEIRAVIGPMLDALGLKWEVGVHKFGGEVKEVIKIGDRVIININGSSMRCVIEDVAAFIVLNAYNDGNIKLSVPGELFVHRIR
jgi:hypothetical protein